MKVLLLGSKGMLGHMVNHYLQDNNIEVITTEYRWPSDELKSIIKSFEGDFIINCIGAIHQRTKNFEVNWELPIFLDVYSKCNVIHPGTDCEMDEDNYGISKKIARDFIVNYGKKTKSIKTSIIGPELSTNASLLEWFLSQPDGTTINGYSEYYWNGNTTLTWAKFCLDLMKNWNNFEKETILSSDCISKFEMLKLFSEIFEKKINIVGVAEPKINKCLDGNFTTPNLKEQLKQLKSFTGKIS